MLYGKNSKENVKGYKLPVYCSEFSKFYDKRLEKYSLNDFPIGGEDAYKIVKDELLIEGNARQNLATFCQTYMDDYAGKIMAETLDKNAIDKTEYPRATEIENRCVNMIAELWHASEKNNFLGVSTVGSSEAVMLAGLAMKFRWREKAKKNKIDIKKKKPNIIISSGYQICWEKFATYFDIELREIPVSKNHLKFDTGKLLKNIDEYTIGVVGILGVTYTGQYEDIEKIDQILTERNKKSKMHIHIHVDAASGGLFAPFVQPDLKWDFRLKNVISINASGHKYGLVYPGLGFLVFKDEKYLPEELVFNVSYLGGEMPTLAMNFSRSASNIIGQYYNFLAYGKKGYKEIHEKTRETTIFLAKNIKATGYFEMINSGEDLPVICYKLKEDAKVKWDLYDLSDVLKMEGWQVPTYPLPKNLENVIVQRCVIRADFEMNMADDFLNDFFASIEKLNKARILNNKKRVPKKSGFTH